MTTPTTTGGGPSSTKAELGSAPANAATTAAAESRLDGWISSHEEELRRHLTRMLGTVPDAEDVLQDVWITAHRKPPDDGPGTNVRAWLYRVATNAALDRLARERRQRELLAERPRQMVADARPTPDAFLGTLDEAARERVRRRVAELPRKQREAVWLRWAEGADYEVIANVLESSQESARANVYQAMKKLREDLRDVWSEGGTT